MAEVRWEHTAVRGEGGMGKVAMYLVVVLVVGSLLGVGIYVGTRVTDDREALEKQLNSRYEETIELNVRNTKGQAVDVVIDGEGREDCETTEDCYLECADDPQPTLTSGSSRTRPRSSS